MGWKRKVGIGCGSLVGLLLAAVLGVWIWKPWVPPIVISDPGPEGRRVAEPGLFANYFPGRGKGPRPAILQLGGSEGGLSENGAKQAKALAGEGYAVLQLSYFRSPGQPAKLERVPLETFTRALAWLRARPEVAGDRIAVIGGSKGGEAALLVAVRDPKLKAVVAGLPSSVAWAGFDWADFSSGDSSWTEKGRPLPYLALGPLDWKDVATRYRSGLAALPDRPDAAIPVERSAAPILLVCGEQDSMWPSCPMARQVEARARRFGRPKVTLLAYADAGHGAFGAPRAAGDPSIARLGSMGGSGEGNNAARRDAWPKTLAFLRANLGR